MNRKSGEQLAIGSIAAVGLGAALLIAAPPATAQNKTTQKAAAGPATFRDCPTCPEMVRIAGGTFMMGSPPTEMGRNEDEGPQRLVTVKPFAAGKFEITFDEWDACVADGGCPPPPAAGAAPAAAAPGRGAAAAGGAAALAASGLDQATIISLIQQSGGDTQALALLAAERGISRAQIAQIQALISGQAAAQAQPAAAQGGRGRAAAPPAPAAPGADGGFGRGKQPAINISWNDAQTYVAWLNKKTGKAYRLLTEAEWEYASRAGTSTVYFWGDEANHDFANYEGTGGKDTWTTRPAPVGSLNPNPWGLHDISGNAAEWVQDCWAEDYAGAPVDGSARQEPGCGARVLRGASWSSSEILHRSANRDWVGETYKSASTGFRVARGL